MAGTPIRAHIQDLTNGGLIIRRRTATGLLDDTSNISREQLMRDLLAGGEVRHWPSTRTRQALEIESTFRMLRILRTIEYHAQTPGESAR